MTEAVTQVLLVLLWATVIVRLPTLWRDDQQRALWAVMFLLTLAKTTGTPQSLALLGRHLPHPDTVPHLIGVCVGYFLLRFLALITGRTVRHQLLLAVAVAATLIFFIGTGEATGSAAYWVVLDGYLGTVLTAAGVIFWRAARATTDDQLRRGLRAMAVGVLVIGAYAFVKTGLIVAGALGAGVSFDRIAPAANTVRALATLLAVVGAALPASNKIRSIRADYRALWRLRPLWSAMRRTFPGVILFSRRRALYELAGVPDVRLRLYRRVIEIRDGMLALRSYLPGEARSDAEAFLAAQAGTAPDPALVEACGIALALHRYRRGDEPCDAGARWADVGSELADEVSWLGRVSAAFTRPEPRAFTGS